MDSYDNINNNENIVPLFNSGVSSSQTDVSEPAVMQQDISSGYEAQNDIPPSLGTIKNLTEAPTAEAPTGDVLGPMNIMPMDLPQADPLTSYDNNVQFNQPVAPQYNIPSEPQYSAPEQPIPQPYNIPEQPEVPQYTMSEMVPVDELQPVTSEKFIVPTPAEPNLNFSPSNYESHQVDTPETSIEPQPVSELEQPVTFQTYISEVNNSEDNYEVVNAPLEIEPTYEVVDNTVLSEEPNEEDKDSTLEDLSEEKLKEVSDDDQNSSEEESNDEDVLGMMEEEDLVEEPQEEKQLEKELSQPEKVIETSSDRKSVV